MDDLIELKILIRKTAPEYGLDDISKDKFLSLLRSLYNKLQPLFSEFLTETSRSGALESVSNKKEEIIKQMNDDNLALISANSSKKKLKNIGIDPRRLIITGGPLTVNDYEKLNPNLTDDAIKGIELKCNRLKKQLSDENWEKKELIFIYESENTTDKLILKRLDEISKMIGKKIILIELTTWNEIDK